MTSLYHCVRGAEGPQLQQQYANSCAMSTDAPLHEYLLTGRRHRHTVMCGRAQLAIPALFCGKRPSVWVNRSNCMLVTFYATLVHGTCVSQPSQLHPAHLLVFRQQRQTGIVCVRRSNRIKSECTNICVCLHELVCTVAHCRYRHRRPQWQKWQQQQPHTHKRAHKERNAR